MNSYETLLSGQISLYSEGGMPKLITAEELSPKIYIPIEKILELAKQGKFPCVRIPGRDEPLFLLKNATEYAKREIFQIQDGKPYHLHVHTDKSFSIEQLPRSLRSNSEQLFLFEFTDIPCVYFLVTDDEVVYVGQSVNLNQRLSMHADKQFETVFYMPVPERDLLEIEGRFIRLLKPKYNVFIPPEKIDQKKE